MQLQWHWVCVLHMGSSCTVMVFQREMWTEKFQHWGTTTGRFITDSIIPLQLIMAAQICIFLPSPLMIDPLPHKRSRYTPDLIPTAISVDSENYVSTFNTPSDSTYILPNDDPNIIHVMKKSIPLKGRLHRGYCCRKHGRKICYKKTRFY